MCTQSQTHARRLPCLCNLAPSAHHDDAGPDFLVGQPGRLGPRNAFPTLVLHLGYILGECGACYAEVRPPRLPRLLPDVSTARVLPLMHMHTYTRGARAPRTLAHLWHWPAASALHDGPDTLEFDLCALHRQDSLLCLTEVPLRWTTQGMYRMWALWSRQTSRSVARGPACVAPLTLYFWQIDGVARPRHAPAYSTYLLTVPRD